MSQKYTAEELNKLNQHELVGLVLSMQKQVGTLNDNVEKLIEMIRTADQFRFGWRTERLDQIAGQINLFNEAEAYSEEAGEELGEEEVLEKKAKRKKKKRQREEDLKGLPREAHDHLLTDEQLDAFFGRGCWRRMKPDKYIRVRC